MTVVEPIPIVWINKDAVATSDVAVQMAELPPTSCAGVARDEGDAEVLQVEGTVIDSLPQENATGENEESRTKASPSIFVRWINRGLFVAVVTGLILAAHYSVPVPRTAAKPIQQSMYSLSCGVPDSRMFYSDYDAIYYNLSVEEGRRNITCASHQSDSLEVFWTIKPLFDLSGNPIESLASEGEVGTDCGRPCSVEANSSCASIYVALFHIQGPQVVSINCTCS